MFGTTKENYQQCHRLKKRTFGTASNLNYPQSHRLKQFRQTKCQYETSQIHASSTQSPTNKIIQEKTHSL